MESIPIVLFWACALLGLFGKSHALLYLFFASMAFGSFAVVPPELTSGLTLTPTPVVALLIILRSLCSLGGMKFCVAALRSPKRLLLLFMFWLVALVTAFFMPRLFAWEVIIIPVRLTLATVGEPLIPSPQNFSQLAYLTISVFATLAFARTLRAAEQRQHALQAMCLGATMVVMTGLLDYMAQYVALDGVLQPFRTATYALMTEVQILGNKRVVGLMPEASAFGSLCLSFLCLLYFFRPAIASRWLRLRVVPLLIYALVMLIGLSTSSSAYVGLSMFALVAVIEWLWKNGRKSGTSFANRSLGFETWSALAALTGLAVIVMFKPSLLDPVVGMINESVLQKMQSSSYEERSLWTAVGWQALVDTWGLGVGVGGTRTSNFAAAVFSNTGVIGGLLYFAFVLQSLRRKLPSGSDGSCRTMLHALRCAYLPPFLISLLVGTTTDFGTLNAFLYGLALAIVLQAPSHACNQAQRYKSLVWSGSTDWSASQCRSTPLAMKKRGHT